MSAFSSRLLAALLVSVTGGCAKKPPPAPAPEPPPQPYRLCLEASPDLNAYDGTAHTLYVRILPLAGIDGFNQADAEKLLDPEATVRGAIDTPSERTLFPGDKVTVEFPRKPEITHFGVVAGYFQPTGSRKTVRPVSDARALGACIRLGPSRIGAE